MVLTQLIKGVFYKKNFFIIYKMSEDTNLTHYQKSRDVILNRAKDYYGNNKQKLGVQARDKQRNLFEEEKNKKENIPRKDITICLKKRNID